VAPLPEEASRRLAISAPTIIVSLEGNVGRDEAVALELSILSRARGVTVSQGKSASRDETAN